MLHAFGRSIDEESFMPATASKVPAARRKPRRKATPATAVAAPALPKLQEAGGAAVRSLARQLHSWTGSLLGGVGTAADMSLALAAAAVTRPGPKAAVAKAAALVKDAREAAGLTLDDLGEALDLKDPTFMALVESGKVGLPFELILRMATILGRNDPITFILQLTRSYNPRVWKSLEALGIGKLLVQAGREREFANIYRSNTAARQLSDRDFAAALAFSAAAFESALVFLGHAKKPPVAAEAGRGAAAGD
jgi:transcriptional regulator with XRE-family HTH domain